MLASVQPISPCFLSSDSCAWIEKMHRKNGTTKTTTMAYKAKEFDGKKAMAKKQKSHNFWNKFMSIVVGGNYVGCCFCQFIKIRCRANWLEIWRLPVCTVAPRTAWFLLCGDTCAANDAIVCVSRLPSLAKPIENWIYILSACDVKWEEKSNEFIHNSFDGESRQLVVNFNQRKTFFEVKVNRETVQLIKINLLINVPIHTQRLAVRPPLYDWKCVPLSSFELMRTTTFFRSSFLHVSCSTERAPFIVPIIINPFAWTTLLRHGGVFQSHTSSDIKH